MDRIHVSFRLAAIFLVACMGSGCVQQTTAAPQPEPALLSSASTRLAAQATQIAALETSNASLATEIARHREFISYLATRIPPYLPTTRPRVPTPFNGLSGGLSIEGGKCCVGGVAGEQLEITIEFSASSPFAKVTDMRVTTGLGALSPDAIEQADWEPFVSSKSFVVTPPINWVGFYVAVQYRDALGNLSEVIRADISVEGAPSAPRSTPGS